MLLERDILNGPDLTFKNKILSINWFFVLRIDHIFWNSVVLQRPNWA